MKATEQYFPVVLFIMLYKVVVTFEFGRNLKCGHSNETYKVVLSCGTVCYAELCGSTFFCQSVNETLVNTEMKAIVKGGGAGSVLF